MNQQMYDLGEWGKWRLRAVPEPEKPSGSFRCGHRPVGGHPNYWERVPDDASSVGQVEARRES